MNILAVVNQAEDELGLPRSTSVGGSIETQARQLLALLNSFCEELLDAHDWSGLQSEATVPTTAGVDRYSLPADFRRMLNDTQYDRSGHWRVYGPISPQVDTAIREGFVAAASVFGRFRLYGTTDIRFSPVPSGQTVFFNYISCHFGRSSTGTSKGRLDSDTDTTVFRSQVLIAGLKWKYMAAKGFAADMHFTDYTQLRDRLIADDVGGREISFGRNPTACGLADTIVVVLPGA